MGALEQMKKRNIQPLHAPLCPYHGAVSASSMEIQGICDLSETQDASAPQTIKSEFGDNMKFKESEGLTHEGSQLH